MDKMIAIGDTLVSEELITSMFCCNTALCLGMCCVEGDAGAPLTGEEIRLLEENIPYIKKFMRTEAVEALDHEGVYVLDVQEKQVTPLLNGKECIYTVFENGVACCAIEKAWEAGAIAFRKPVSCHLYPVRVGKFRGCTAVNVHRWHVCESAWNEGKTRSVPLYKYLKEALIRRFGTDWYQQLCIAAEWNKNS